MGYRTNKTKIKHYNSNPIHKQTIISGERKDKSQYTLICDEFIINLIKELNKINCRTLWSCQGDNNHPAYIVISGGYITKRILKQVNEIIHKYWNHYYFIETRLTSNGDVAFYGYSKITFKKYFKNILNDNLIQIR